VDGQPVFLPEDAFHPPYYQWSESLHPLGLDTPRAWIWSQENKIFSCLMAYFLCNMMETHFLSTGAFEVTLNDVPLWSKLQSGYVPNIQEIFKILDNQLKINTRKTSSLNTHFSIGSLTKIDT
ncbi:hypothetical protein fugu_011341, partial [Takifugu bimaculatus]